MKRKACFILSKDSLQSSKKVINSSAIDTLGKRIESNEKREKKQNFEDETMLLNMDKLTTIIHLSATEKFKTIAELEISSLDIRSCYLFRK